MSSGKWYLIYTHVNEMEAGTFRDGIEDVEIPLKATSEDVALSEGREKWKEVQKERVAHPPFLKTSPNPRVVYRILL